MKSQYDTKYTVPLVIVSVLTIIVYFFSEGVIIESIAFTLLALLLSLNFYEAYIAEDKQKHKIKLSLSIIIFIVFLGYTISLLVA
ncbi:MAG TPA: hypothetical protein VFC83_02430 [Erysipelotrichaceae bacterium]|nr:hypothetical protein [Erysipelotrichaceae bacterium]